MSTAPRRAPAAGPTVADVAFPDGREGVFAVRATSTVRRALTAFALAGMALREEPVPVLTQPPDNDAEAPDAPMIQAVVGSISANRLGELVEDAGDDQVSDHLGEIPPMVPGDLSATEAIERIADHEIAVVVRGQEVIGMVTRSALVEAVRPAQ